MVGVGIGPPNVLLAPKPTSSVRISKMLGAPFGALTSPGKSGVESLGVNPMCPLNGGAGRGKVSWAFVGIKHPNANTVIINFGSTRRPVKRFILTSFHRPICGARKSPVSEIRIVTSQRRGYRPSTRNRNSRTKQYVSQKIAASVKTTNEMGAEFQM